MPLHATTPQALLISLYKAAVEAAQPHAKMASILPPCPKGKTIVLGAGKAAAAMVYALEDAIASQWPASACKAVSGVVVTRQGHIPPRPAHLPAQSAIRILEASHPVPDARSENAARQMLAQAQAATADDLVIFLVSGGGSALLCLPAEGLTLAQKQAIHQQLLHSGAPIDVMNGVRKHLSSIKGGRLLQACAPARVCTIAISDVPGDDLSIIASGPTIADDSTCAQTLRWLAQYGIEIPASIHARLEDGTLETPKPAELHAMLERASTHLIATPMQSLQAARREAERQGLRAYILGDRLEGESRDLGLFHARLAQSIQAGKSDMQAPCVLLSGGETTVTFTHTADKTKNSNGCNGSSANTIAPQGGRAMEFCMGLANALQAQSGIWGIAADTDGIDGNSPAAGAQVSPHTIANAQANGMALADALLHHKGHAFFHASGELVETGPTHTNVNDFRAIVVL